MIVIHIKLLPGIVAIQGKRKIMDVVKIILWKYEWKGWVILEHIRENMIDYMDYALVMNFSPQHNFDSCKLCKEVL